MCDWVDRGYKRRPLEPVYEAAQVGQEDPLPFVQVFHSRASNRNTMAHATFGMRQATKLAAAPANSIYESS